MITYYIRLDNDGVINAISTAQAYDWLQPFETDIDLEADLENVRIIDRVVKFINIWHYPEKPYRFYIPNTRASDVVLDMPWLPAWVKKEKMLRAKVDDGNYIYAGILQPVVDNDVTYPVAEIVYDLVYKYGCDFQYIDDVLNVS